MAYYPRILISQVPIFLIGFAIVQLTWKGFRPVDLLVKIFLGQGLGMGVDACLYFLWSLVFTPFNPFFFWLEMLLALVGSGLVIRKFLKNLPASIQDRPGLTLRWPIFGLAAVFVFAAGVTIAAYGLSLYSRPSGSFDAYAIWNLKARFIFYSPHDWTLAFSPLITWKAHTDYPLLWPMNILRIWLLLGRDAVEAGIVQTALFFILIPGLTVGGLLKLRDLSQALLGGILILGMPAFLNYSTFQVADPPLAFFYMATLLLLLLYERNQDPGLLILAGLATGLAGWTKNEGLMFEIAVAVYLLARFLRRPLRASLRKFGWFGLGLLLPLATTLVFKAFLAPPGDIMGVQTAGELLTKILDPTRYATILAYLLNYLPNLGGWIWPAAASVPLYALAAGKTRVQPGWLAFMILGITFLGYFGVYLITPKPLEWHLTYSLDRLMFQLLIPGLFLMLALIRSPVDLFRNLSISGRRE